MEVSAKVLLKSINRKGDILTTFQIVGAQEYHAQFIRHRLASYSIFSMRGISPKKQINDYLYIPEREHLRYEEPGMVGNKIISEEDYELFLDWYNSLHDYIKEEVHNCPVALHSQSINRILQPFRYFRCIVTTTDFGLENFFSLRLANDAQPSIAKLAMLMEYEYRNIIPQELDWGEWHIPLIDNDTQLSLLDKLKSSSCRTARTSYGLYVDAKPFSLEKELSFADKLAQDKHYSPLEHSARAMEVLNVNPYQVAADVYSDIFRNFRGFSQYRMFVENGFDVLTETSEIYNKLTAKHIENFRKKIHG